MGLLERSRQLDELDRALDAAASGSGRLVVLAGEAGVGKSALVQHFAASVGARGDVFLGACDPLSTPRPLGPLLDVAAGLSPGLENLLGDTAQREAIFRGVLDALRDRSRPATVVFEDVHWADEATLDLLQFLGRRIGDLPALLVASYRHDEVGIDHPLRRVLGDLATAAAVHRVRIPPLSPDGVAALAEGTGRDPVELHRRTGGNPFFVTEILAVPGPQLPDSVRDAVLARASRLSDAGRRSLEAAAVIGFRVEPELLAELTGGAADAADECVARGVLQADDRLLRFRHDLAREAILASLAPQRRIRLHRAVLARLRAAPGRSDPDGLARLAHHAEEAGDAEAVLAFAPVAAKRAAQLKAHREAAAQYARALRFAGSLPPRERAALLEARAYEGYLTSDIDDAVAARREALALRREAGDLEHEGANLRWLSRLSWFLGRRDDAERFAREAVEVLEPAGPGLELAWAYSNQAQLCMLAQEDDAAVRWGERAVRLAETVGSVEVQVHALNNIGTVLYCRGEDEGSEKLEASLRLARAHDFEEHVARAYTNLASIAVPLRQLERAERWLDEGIAYCIERDLDAWRLYMLGWRAVTLLYLGRWSEAAETATTTLSHSHLPVVSRIQPLLVLGSVRTRRGDPEAWDALDEAWDLARETAELQRMAPVVAARAEAAWFGGRGRDELPVLRRIRDQAIARSDPWFAGETEYWCWKLGDDATAPAWIARPFALQLAGEGQAAAAAWTELGHPFEAARALAEADDPDALHRAHAAFARLGAEAAMRSVAQRLRELGLDGPPTGPRRTTLRNPAQLTPRQLQVLQLMAEGLSNVQIAGRLHRSTKTIDHHVSAVLAKLEVQNRTEAVRKAVEDGIV